MKRDESGQTELRNTPRKKSRKNCFLRGCVCCVFLFISLVLITGACLSMIPAAPADYTTKTKTGGPIEAKYLAMGEYAVRSTTADAEEPVKKLTIAYPEKMETDSRKWPVVVQVNGTGILPEKYPSVFNHLASWGFIVIGNDDPGTWSGESAEKTLDWLLHENEREGSVFFQKVDTSNIGIVGHSQGGVGTFNAVTVQPHAGLYRAVVALSPTNEETAEALKIPYDISKVKVPVLMAAGTVSDFEVKMVIPLDIMKRMYARLSVPKAMMRRKECDHGQMLYFADGYVTAWFMWLLQNDKEAAKAFVGEKPELLTNPLYQDQESDLGERTVPDEAETKTIRELNGI